MTGMLGRHVASMGGGSVLIQELRGAIGQALNQTIAIRRASQLEMGRDEAIQSSSVTEDEVDEFLLANPLFDASVVQLLFLPPGMNPAAVSVSVNDDWLADFHRATSEWVETSSWLAADDPWVAVGPGAHTPTEAEELWIPGQPLLISKFSVAPTTFTIAERLLSDGRGLSALSWRELEVLLADLLDADGWSVQLTPPSGDGGVDVLAARDDPVIGPILTVWQAKRYAPHRKIGIETIRELITVREDQHASKAFIVTTSTLTTGALSRVNQERYKLGAVQGPDLSFWVKRIAESQQD